MIEYTYTTKNYLGFAKTLTSRRDDMRIAVFIQDQAGEWTARLSPARNMNRAMAALSRANPDARMIHLAHAARVA